MVPDAVKDVVRRQADLGIDIVNDGEFSKRGGFSGYVRSAHERHRAEAPPADQPRPQHDVTARDRAQFPGAFAAGVGPFRGGNNANAPFFCIWRR